MSSGKIYFNGSQGTCWLIAPNRVITAAHCVGAAGTEATVNFGNDVVAKVLDRDDDLDAAVLEIATLDTSAQPLNVCERPRNSATSKWTAFGFPGVLEEHVHGLTVGGTIRNFNARRKVDGDALILQCDEGGSPHLPHLDANGDQAQVFSGMSGSAVCAGEVAGPVVGLWLQSPTALHAVSIYVSPMDRIVERFRESLPDVVVAPWDDAPFLDIRKSDNGTCRVAAFPSLQNIADAWDADSKPLRIACDFSRGESPELQAALLRLVVHAEAIESFEFSNHNEWREAAIQAANNGLPIDNFIATSVINAMPWSALTSRVPLSTTPIELSPADIAKAVHASCNRWTLRRLVSGIDRVLDEVSTAHLIRFDIAADLRDPMREMWRNWLTAFENDPEFLDHFLTLMLTAEGDFNVHKKSLIAAGPRTLPSCLVRLVAYTLAVNCCLQSGFQPSSVPPGNLGNGEHTGHACGIEIHKSKRLHLKISEHEWRTSVVLLPHLEQDASVIHATSLRLNESSDNPNRALSGVLPRTWLLTGAAELHQAMENGRSALTDFLLQKGKEFYMQQKKYLPQEGE